MSTETSPLDAGPPVPAVHLEPGAEPAPGYLLEKLLGRGGFGEVWRAQGPGGVAVAMKFIRLDGKGSTPELRSLEMMKEVRHGNLLSLFGVWEREPFLVLALELADRSLLDRLQEAQAQGQAGIPVQELLEYMRDAARALDFLNEPRHTREGKSGLSIQHRDVKPHNLLLVGDTVKLADFGLARLLERQVTGHTGAMTPAYAAPEFFKGQTSSQSDQYSLAVTYCQLRGGRLPFAGSPEQMMMGHAQEAPDLGMVPEPERPALARALSKDPAARWPSCRAFVQALAAAAQVPLPSAGDATTLRPDAAALTVLPAEPPRKRRRWPWLIAAGLLLALLVGGGLVLRSVLSGHDALSPAAAGPAVGMQPEPAKLRPKGTTGVAFTPDGQIVSVGEDGIVWTWGGPEVDPGLMHLQTATKLHEIADAKRIVLSPDGRRFLTDAGGAVDLWDVQTGSQRRSIAWAAPPGFGLSPKYVIHSKAFSPDGRHLIVDGTETRPFEEPGSRHLLIGDLDGRTRPLSGTDMAETVCVAVSSDGKKALTAGRDAVRLWTVDMMQPVPKIDRGGVISMAFSPDGKQCLLGEEFDTLVLVDADTGKEVHSFVGHGGGVSCVAFSPDGKQALSGGWDKTVRLWDVEADKQLECFRGHQAEVTGVAFAADGTKALSGSKDGVVFLWRLPAGGGK